MTPEATVFVVLLGVVLWGFIRRADREFRRGYLLAVDHIEQMTRPGVFASYELPEAITKLRTEMGAPEKRSASKVEP